MLRNRKTKNIFANKATYILRKMLKEPAMQWVLRDFTGKEGVSLGMAQAILSAMEKQGYIEWYKKGPESYSILTNRDELLSAWLKAYQFDLNLIDTYYTPDNEILKKVKAMLNPEHYALTLHTGANLITSYVKTEDIYIYLSLQDWQEKLIEIRQQLDLKELVRGGNFYVVKPFYKTSIFINTQIIKGFTVVSNLQLYLDLYNFQPRGKEHAEFLKKLLKEKGKDLD